jgi:hypothetical protein
VLPSEGRRTPDLLYAALAVCGLTMSAWRRGEGGFAWTLASALVVVATLTGVITVLRAALRLRLLTGGQIKLMAQARPGLANQELCL